MAPEVGGGREPRYPLALTRDELADVLDALEHRRDLSYYHSQRHARLLDLEARVYALRSKADERRRAA